MAELSRFFPSIGSDRLYTASQVNEYLYETLEEENGVLHLPVASSYAGELAVTNAGTLSVDIATGAAVKAGVLYLNSASLNKSLTAVTSGYQRYDRIVIRSSAANRNMVATIIAGTEVIGTPTVPSVVAGTDVLLAKILINRSSGTYVYTVTDEREFRSYLFVSDDAIASAIHGSASKTTLASADEFAVIDTAASNVLKKIPFSSLAATTGIESAYKFPKAMGAEIAAILTAGGYTLTAPSGANSLDGIADTVTWKKVAAAVATALNAGTYDAASVATRGIGTATPPAMVTSCDAYNIGGLYTDSGALTNSSWSGSASRILVLPISTTNVTQLAFRNGTNHIRIREYAASAWTAWKEVWTADSDGNGGQPPSAKSNQVSNATIGWFAAVDCASGAGVTLPSGGTFEWFVTTYGATYNSVKSGISAGGAMTGTASANLTMYYKRLTA